jgi:chromosome segregation ATPase
MEENAQQRYRSEIRELETSLQETQQKLNELQSTKKEGQRFILSPEQQQELEKFRRTEAQVKVRLKELRRNLRREVDSLENRVKWLNIAAMPLIVTATGIAAALYKRKKTAAQ